MRREIPPTAGLPLQLADLAGPTETLTSVLGRHLDGADVQLECSGTAAFLIALEALRRRQPRRTRVVLPGYTCPLMALAVRQAGLELRLCDLRADSFDLDLAALEAVCDERTLAVVPTHLGGRIADVDGALAVARRVGAFVIEDAAQALGARRGGRSVGFTGDVGFFSLAAGKGLTTFEGGVLVTRDADLRIELRAAASDVPRRPGFELRRSLELLGYFAFYRPAGLPLVYGRPLREALRRGDLLAAVRDDLARPLPLHRLGRWRQRVAARSSRRWPGFLADAQARGRSRCATLRERGVAVPGDHAADQSGAWPVLMVLMHDEEARDAALARLWTRGVGVSRMFAHALTDYEGLRDFVPRDPVPRSREFAARLLTVSNSGWLDDERFDWICDELVDAARRARAAR